MPTGGPDGAVQGSGADTPRRRLGDLLPRSALGLAMLVFCVGVSAAFTGAVLYAYYDARLAKTEQKVEDFGGSFTDQLEAATAIIADEAETARQQIRDQLDELEKFTPSGQTLTELLDRVQPSVWFVSTLDELGQASVGSAFVVFADTDQSYLLTSFTTVRAATVQPAPVVTVRKGDEELAATLFTWDPATDLALLTIPVPSQPALPWSTAEPSASVGDRVFVVSGLGAAGGAIVQGTVADVSAVGLQHDVPIGAAFQGGPLIDANGDVVAVASRTYAPLNFVTDAVFFAPLIRAACDKVLQCPEGAQPG
jgi:S1-C subfamily serine protease